MISSIESLQENDVLKPALVTALRHLLFTQTYLKSLKPHYDELCQQVIVRFKPVVENRECYQKSKRLQNTINQPITDYFHLYQASESKAHAIYRWHKAQMETRGFVAKGEGRCPYAVAEVNNIEAERILIDVMAPYTGISSDVVWNTKLRASLVNAIQGLLVSLACSQGIELNLLKLEEAKV